MEFDHYRKIAENQFGTRLSWPILESSVEEIEKTINDSISNAEKELSEMVKLPEDKITFNNTFKKLDQIFFDAQKGVYRIYLAMNTHSDQNIRNKAQELVLKFNEWSNKISFREDIYETLQKYAQKERINPTLKGEDLKFYQETLRDYKRIGFELTKAKRQEAQTILNKLSKLSSDFQENIRESKDLIVLSNEETEGIDPKILSELPKNENGLHTIRPTIATQRDVVLSNSPNEQLRKKIFAAKARVAMNENANIFKEIIKNRQELAKVLGYENYAQYVLEIKMAKKVTNVQEFLEDLRKGLQKKFDQELKTLEELKRQEVNNDEAQINSWDIAYFSKKLKMQKYDIDEEELKNYFEYNNVLKGMFQTYEHLFGIKIQRVNSSNKYPIWHEDVTPYIIYDQKDQSPLGVLFLDMFPREGKYTHFAQFGIIHGKQLENGSYQRPSVALICNFPRPQADIPSLLKINEVETLFHEFGHALHSIFTMAKYERFSGTSVPRDFVEAPSQMLENWVKDKSVLDTFAKHWKNPEQKLSKETIEKLDQARKVTKAIHYRAQLAFGMMDMAFHTKTKHLDDLDVTKISNDILSQVYLPYPENTSFISSFGHLAGGYAAGYYGYLWSEAISFDMASLFKVSDEKFFDQKLGIKLRKEIYQQGDSRDINQSIEAFLGRPTSNDAFFEDLGLQ